MPRCLLVGERFQRTGKRAVLEAQPCSSRAHVELIIECVRLSKPQCLLLAVKYFVHDEIDSGKAIARQRERYHGPGSPSPWKRCIRNVLILGKHRYIGIVQSQKMFSRYCVVCHDQACLAVDEGYRAAQSSIPKCSG